MEAVRSKRGEIREEVETPQIGILNKLHTRLCLLSGGVNVFA